MELTLKNLTPLGPPIPVYERKVEVTETEDFDLGFHEFHFEEKNSETTHPLTLNFTERDLDTLVTGFEQTAGNVIDTFSPPVTIPDDIVDAILDDMGIGQPQAEAFKVLLTGDWKIVDER